MSKENNSPATSADGIYFEGKVLGHYLLAMLSEMPSRGLSTSKIIKASAQQSGEYPLDDIVVNGINNKGESTSLQIQAKRSITFSAQDPVFKQVCNQIAAAISKEKFWEEQNYLAIAFPNTTTQIDNDYQEVLRIAQSSLTEEKFKQRLNNKKMETFLKTFKENLQFTIEDISDENIYNILQRLYLLHFDYNNPASLSIENDCLRADKLLSSSTSESSRKFIDSLWVTGGELSSTAGEIDRDTLIDSLIEKGYQINEYISNYDSLTKIQDETKLALLGINDSICSMTLNRSYYINQVHTLFQDNNIVEICGDSGVGKSGILKAFGMQRQNDSICFSIAPERGYKGSLNLLLNNYGYNGSYRDFLNELSLGRRGYILIDNLERLSGEEQVTVKDILNAGKDIKNLKILITSRRSNEWSWIDTYLDTYSKTTIIINYLSQTDINDLCSLLPKFKALLLPYSVANPVLSNLYLLSLLYDELDNDDLSAITQLDLMNKWYASGCCNSSLSIRIAKRLIVSFGKLSLNNISELLDVSENDNDTVINQLVASKTFVEKHDDKMDFYHDILRQWSMAIALRNDENFDLVKSLNLDMPATVLHINAIKLLAQDRFQTSSEAWSELYRIFNATSVHRSWRRAVVLGVLECNGSHKNLIHFKELLLSNNCELLAELIGYIKADIINISSSNRGGSLASTMEVSLPVEWYNLTEFLIQCYDNIPEDIQQASLSFICLLSEYSWGFGVFSETISNFIYVNLVLLENRKYRPHYNEIERILRKIFFKFCIYYPEKIQEYLTEARILIENKVESFENAKHLDILRYAKYATPIAGAEMRSFVEVLLVGDGEGFACSFRSELKPFSPANNLEFFNYKFDSVFKYLLEENDFETISLFIRLYNHYSKFSKPLQVSSRELSIEYNSTEYLFAGISVYNDTFIINNMFHATVLYIKDKLADNEWSPEIALNSILLDTKLPFIFLHLIIGIIYYSFPASAEAAVSFLSIPVFLELFRSERLFAISKFHGSYLEKTCDYEYVLWYYSVHADKQLLTKLTTCFKAELEKLPPVNSKMSMIDMPFFLRNALNLLDSKNYTLVKQIVDEQEVVSLKYSPSEIEIESAKIREDQRTPAEDFFFCEPDTNYTDEEIDSFVIIAKQKIQYYANTLNKSLFDSDFEKSNIIYLAYNILKNNHPNYYEWAKEILLPLANIKHLFGNEAKNSFSGICYYLLKDNFTYEVIEIILLAVSKQMSRVKKGITEVCDEFFKRYPKLLHSIVRCTVIGETYPVGYRSYDTERQCRLDHENAVRTAIDRELKWLLNSGEEPNLNKPPKPRISEKFGITIGGKSKSRLEKQIQDSDFVYYGNYTAEIISAIGIDKFTQLPISKDFIDSYYNWMLEANGFNLEPKIDLEEKYKSLTDVIAQCMILSNYNNIDALKRMSEDFSKISDIPALRLLCNVLTVVDMSLLGNMDNLIHISQVRCSIIEAMQNNNEFLYTIKGTRSDQSVSCTFLLYFNSYKPSYSREYICKSIPKLKEIALLGCSPALTNAVMTFVYTFRTLPEVHELFREICYNWISCKYDNSQFWHDVNLGSRICLYYTDYLNSSESIESVEMSQIIELVSILLKFGIPEASKLESLCSKHL